MSLDGKLDLQLKQGQIEIKKDHLYLLEDTCEHGFRASENNTFLILDIPAHLFSKNEKEYIKSGLLVQMDDKWRAIRYLLQNEVNQSVLDTTAVRRLFEYFKPMLKDYHSPSLKHMHQHYDKAFKIEELADLEHYSVAYFHQWFKAKTGETPRAYLQKLRLQKACDLLLETDFSLFRIALEVGYQHQSSLTKAFYKQLGMGPLEWKKNRLG